uniref:hypothetical protein n=1 Tax=unclassified Endozoicomonas TaxID=2644528 RepID=UPI00214985C5
HAIWLKSLLGRHFHDFAVTSNALFWLSLGFLLFRLENKKDYYIFFIIGASVFLTIICFVGRIPSLDMAKHYYEYPLLNIIWAISMIGLFVSGSRLLTIYNDFGFLKLVSKYFLLIYLLHSYTNNAAYLIVVRFFDGQWFYTFVFSLLLISLFVLVRSRLGNSGIFKYV